MDCDELITEITRLVEATQETNPAASAILMTLKASVLVRSESLLLTHIMPFADMQLEVLTKDRQRREAGGN